MKQYIRPSCQWNAFDVPIFGARFPASQGGRIFPSEPTPLERLQAQLLARALRAFPQPHFELPLRRASGRAVRLAEETGFPLLVLPELFAEIAIPSMLRSDYRLKGRF